MRSRLLGRSMLEHVGGAFEFWMVEAPREKAVDVRVRLRAFGIFEAPIGTCKRSRQGR